MVLIMNKEEISKKDWKIFQEKLPHWQEQYMGKLLEEYTLFINNKDLTPSYRYHELQKRIREDKKKPGVEVFVNKKDMIYIIVKLIIDGAITIDDLSDFSNDLKEEIRKYLFNIGV